VDHVRYLCVQQRALAGKDRGSIATDFPPRHIIIMIHLPPGIQSRVRHYAVDFYAPWSCAFVDDIRAEFAFDQMRDREAVMSTSLSLQVSRY
jgi:hypothetical protein